MVILVETIRKNLPSSKRSLKAPYAMSPKGFTLHNTYNDATAENEINYMQSNNNAVSFHYAIDDIQIVQGLPLNRNGWHAGDGTNGYGNRNTYGVEICYSKSGGERYDKAEDNAILFVAQSLYDNGWGIDKVWKHKDWSGKNCPHRILARSRGWEGIVKEIEAELNRLKGKKTSPSQPSKPKNDISKKSVETLAKEVIAGKWESGEARKKALGSRYDAVQKRVNQLLATPKKKDPVQTKGVETLAKEVLAGKWGHGDERKRRLGNRYTAVQNRVNQIHNQQNKTKKKQKSVEQLAKEVIDGKHKTGEARKKSLGSRYDAVQKRVNQLLKGRSTKPKKSLSKLVDEVNKGLHGNGDARKQSLGADYNRVQAEINRRARRK